MIEAGSFVSARKVPQMAGTGQVFERIVRRAGTIYSALTPNLTGFAEALAHRADEVAVFASASEGFSQANINCSIADSLQRFVPVMRAARAGQIPVRGYVSCTVNCPYDGPVAPRRVARVATALHKMGCSEISLGDTTGHAEPQQVSAMLDAVLEHLPASCLAGHFHDTAGAGIANIIVGLQKGLRIFDSAAGGLGGCPFAPGAKGNVSTSKVVQLVHQQGFATGVDARKLARAEIFARTLVM